MFVNNDGVEQLLESEYPASTKRWFILFFVMSGVFLSTLDSGMINVALPAIMRFYQLSVDDTELVITVYLLTITSTLVFWGRVADKVGRGKMYVIGLACFAMGALTCYFSATFRQLLMCRFFQAIGASIMMSSGPAIIKQSFPDDYVGRSLGLVGIATACGLLAGPFFSGQLLVSFEWKNIFLVTALVGTVVFAGAFFLLPRYVPQIKQTDHEKFDWPGGVCWVAMALLLVFLVDRVPVADLSQTLILLIVFVLLVILFFYFEGRSTNPIVPLTLFRSNYYWTGVVTAALSFAVLFSVLILIPFYLEIVLTTSFDRIGLVMMSVPATLMVLSPTAGALFDKIGAKIPTTIGLLLTFLALLWLSGVDEMSSLRRIGLNLALLGAGQSIFLSPNTASVLSKVDSKYLGISSGILATSRNFGMVVGATMAMTLFAMLYSLFSGGEVLISQNNYNNEAFIQALQHSFLTLAVISFAAAVISTRRE